MPKVSKIALLTLSVVFVLTVFLGRSATGMSAAGGQQGDSGAFRQMEVYYDVLRHVQSQYVTEPNIPDVTNGALRGLLESLDADSSYLSPADYKAYRAALSSDKGAKGQVGMTVSKRSGYATVVSVVPGSPAEKANLSDGDFLEAINGVDTRDLSLAMIKMMLEGKPGSEVTVSVVRPRKAVPDKVTLTRAVVQEPAVQDQQLENSSILYLKPEILDRDHVNAVESKLKANEKNGPKKVLLDLRDVSAGDWGEAVRLANFFLPGGSKIGSLQGQRVQTATYTAEAKYSIDPSAPLVVLVNHGTAGPGELVAGALQDDKRAELVGDRTFGEGGQQKTFDLPDGGALILTVAKYETPSGKKLEDDAVTPGTLVASGAAVDDDEGAESASETSAPAKTKPAASQPDDQLNKGLELLKGKGTVS